MPRIKWGGPSKDEIKQLKQRLVKVLSEQRMELRRLIAEAKIAYYTYAKLMGGRHRMQWKTYKKIERFINRYEKI